MGYTPLLESAMADKSKKPKRNDEFAFVDAYAEREEKEVALKPNTAESSLDCAFVGLGGGGGKLAAAFTKVGFNRVLLVNTTAKEFSSGLDDDHLLPLPQLDGVAKDVEQGKKALTETSTVVEDALRTRFGAVGWLFVCASGGGGTGSSAVALDATFRRYLSSVEADGGLVYIVTKPTAQELLNPTVKTNYETLIEDLAGSPHILLDNERQLSRLRGKVGVSRLYPAANEMFAKMFAQVLKLTSMESSIQVCDSKDLSRFLSTPGRIMIGSAMVEPGPNLGADLFQHCVVASPCPEPPGKAKVGLLLEVLSEALADDSEVSLHLESAAAYVGGRSETLFSGVYVYDMPETRLISILALGGL
jgi:cell division GTPase FtsZ